MSQEDFVDARRAGELFAAGRFAESDAEFQLLTDHPRLAAQAARQLAHLALLQNHLGRAAYWLERARAQDVPPAALLEMAIELSERQRALPALLHWLHEAGEGAYAARYEALRDDAWYRVSGTTATLVLETAEPLPRVVVEINGVRAHCLVDSAADELVLDPGFARECGARLGGVGQALFAGGSHPVQYGAVDQVDFGGLVVAGVPVQILPLRPLFQGFAGLAVDAVIGTRLLYGLKVEIDSPGRRLTLACGQPSAGPGGVPMWLTTGGRIVLWSHLNHTHPVLALLDTGYAGFAFALAPSTARQLGIAPAGPVQGGLGGGGRVAMAPVTLTALAVGPAMLAPASGALAGDFPLERRFGFRLGGLLGHEFCRRFVLTLDFDCMRVLLDSSRDLQA